MNWKAKLALLAGNAVVIAGTLLGVALLVGECRDFRAKGKAATEPIVAPPTKLEEKAPEKILPCRDVKAIDPAPKDRQKLADKYRRPDLATQTIASDFERSITDPPRPAEIIGEREVQKLPEGGTALLTLEPDGRIELTVVAAPEKLFEWRSTYEFGGLYGIGQAGDTRGRAWAAIEPLRFARLHLRAEAGVDLRNGTSDTYALAGIVWRSRSSN